ncbi:hypothetical protein CVD25_09580 [Bacillus canaveralius]|uniref:ABC transporter domain-containing protein n=1 Tax=Bacillus canaveralius TaxID=1403243 RepID=A0A2N5GGH4_9BACI|nr:MULTISPECIES: ABC transporter ATP-binding protein [Bacillus]PLR79859.1 hypothetical protein CU635_20990 [Bacillus canaveralius]PLR87171.1 hypothetical protein CVD23_04135 [Bacillus sp. V33-4]PLR97792.1 hypothetical protein CVD25_09580 [Bacillus canaveralius]RSK45569.1 ABC transporter ATP-binding protein [Bacillus canaveralius]
MLSVLNVSKVYGESNVIDNVSFNINEGEIVSLVGHNGAGKTTLMKILTGLIIPDKGLITVYGEKWNKKHLKQMSLMLEGNRNFYAELTLYQNIQYLYRLKGFKYSSHVQSSIDYYLKIFNLYDHASKPIFKLSRGMQQKVSIILNFILPSKIILLDEPTLGLDIFSIDEFEKLITQTKANEKIVLITSHQLDLLQKLSDRLIVIHNGKILFNDKPEYFINKYAQINCKITYKTKIPENDLQNLLHKGIAYEVFEDRNEILLQYQNGFELNDYLKMLTIANVESINKTTPKLEEAYKNFWLNEDTA